MLFAKSQVSTGDPDPIKATDERMLFDYLTQEVFKGLPSPLGVFLLQTSVLREFTTGMCNSLLDRSDSERFISQIKIRSLFLEERTGDGAAYKYHDLFKEYLERRFQSEHPDQYIRLNLRAAALYSDLGDDDAAIYHFLRGGEPTRAVEIVKEVSRTYYQQGRWDRLGSWLDRLPQRAVAEDADLLLLRGQVTLRLGNPSESLEQLDKLAKGPHADDPEVLGKALVAKSTAYRRLGDLELALKVARDGLAILKTTRCDPEHLAEAYKQVAAVYNTVGKYDLSYENFQTALSLIGRDSLLMFSMICNDLGTANIGLGNLDQAAMYLEQARIGLLKLGSDGPLAEALNNLSLVYYMGGEFDLALDEVTEVLRILRGTTYPRIHANAMINKAIIERALGAYSDSLSSASSGLELARQILDQRLIAEATSALGSAYRKLGELSKAEVLLNQSIAEVAQSDQKYVSASYRIALAKVYCQLGSYDLALTHSKSAEDQLKELSNSRRMAEAKLCQAAALYRTGRLPDTILCLEEVSRLLSDLGYDGFLLADGDEFVDVLRYGAARRLGGETFTRLVGRLTQSQADQDQTNGVQSESGGLARFPAIQAFSFGHPRVTLDTHQVTEAEWQSRKAKELFFFLYCNRRVLTNEEIMDNLWPGVSVDLSNGALRTNIYRIRQALFYDCILGGDSGYRINPKISIGTDMEDFLRRLDLGADPDQSDEAREQHLEEAILLYQGPFLNGVYSDWCQVFRDDLEIKFHTTLIKLAAYQAGKKNFRRGSELLETVVSADPYNEEAQYQRIVYLLDSGEVVAALQQLRKYAKLCLEELGAALSPRFNECHKRITTLLPSSG